MEDILAKREELVKELDELKALLEEALKSYPDTSTFGVYAPRADGIQAFIESLEQRALTLREARGVKDIQWNSLEVVPGARDFDQVGLTVTDGSPVWEHMDTCRGLALSLYDLCTIALS